LRNPWEGGNIPSPHPQTLKQAYINDSLMKFQCQLADRYVILFRQFTHTW
jgi:hypothetical protein